MTTTTVREQTKVNTQAEAVVKTGAAAAAFIASGIGTFVIGFLTTFAVISEGLKEMLNWWNPAGPLVGKTGLGIIVWLISWGVMHSMWKDKEYDLSRAFRITLILIVLGFILTFPPVFEAFE